MKNSTLFLLIALSSNFMLAQKTNKSEVPQLVISAFEKDYPNIKSSEWEKENDNYECEFKVSKTEFSALYSADGKLLETETEIPVSELPEGIKAFVNQTMPGKKIKEASKIKSADGQITYETEIENQDYLFDEGGILLRKENDEKD